MTFLPDVNLWVALAVAEHVQHKAACAWFETAGNDTVAFCRITEMGLLRLLTCTQLMTSDVFSSSRAWRLVERIQQDERVIFVPEPPALDQAWRSMAASRTTGANFWSHTYLAAFVQSAGLTLVTFDRGFQKHKNLRVHLLGRAAV
ncbi:MAG TPA: TA system VapC family ribonuclease toxin [Bryobacteraceae bacterium]|nr:TA system VapC family ribonuclease toxin [Bryobacteraceae bacterium]